MTEVCSNPGGRSVSATVTYGQTGAALAFHGLPAEVAADIATAFGIDPAGRSLHDIVADASSTARAVGAVVAEFPGTTTVPDEPAQAAADPDAALLDAIAAPGMTVEGLKRLWVEHHPFSEAVETAWRSRGRELQAK